MIPPISPPNPLPLPNRPAATPALRRTLGRGGNGGELRSSLQVGGLRAPGTG